MWLMRICGALVVKGDIASYWAIRRHIIGETKVAAATQLVDASNCDKLDRRGSPRRFRSQALYVPSLAPADSIFQNKASLIIPDESPSAADRRHGCGHLKQGERPAHRLVHAHHSDDVKQTLSAKGLLGLQV